MSVGTKLRPRILVIDDEPQIRRLLRASLEGAGYAVRESSGGGDGIIEAAQHPPDLIVLDLGLPDMEGVAVLKRLREWSRVPIVVLSVRSYEEDKIAALDQGADDFITKPFDSGELLARLRLALRHSAPAPNLTVFRTGPMEVDLAARIATRDGLQIKLTPTEYSMLRLFVQHAGKVLTHRQILQDVWGPNYVGQTAYLRVYMAHLREKLESNSAHPELFVTEPGVGYRLMVRQ